MKQKLKVGILNPFACKAARFEYEVVKVFGVNNIMYKETDGTLSTYPERVIVLRSLNGESRLTREEWLVKISMDDALRPLRHGDVVSVDLTSSIECDRKGRLHQIVTGKNVCSLHDYQQICKAELKNA